MCIVGLVGVVFGLYAFVFLKDTSGFLVYSSKRVSFVSTVIDVFRDFTMLVGIVISEIVCGVLA